MGRGLGIAGRAIACAVLVILGACTARKNVSISTPHLQQAVPPVPSASPPVRCSSLPVTIEDDDGTLTCVSSASGNLDGDDLPDQFALYIATSGSQVDRLVGYAQLGDRELVGSLKLDPRAIPGAQSVKVLGLGDANGDGRDEAFFTLDGGAVIDTIAIAALQGTRLVQVRAGGRPAMFFFGGSDVRGSGIECTGDGASRTLIIRSAATGDGQTFATSETEYRWSSGSASLSYRTRRSGSLAAGAPELKSFWLLRCGTLQVNA